MMLFLCFCFFFNDTATTEIYTLSLHDALPILVEDLARRSITALAWDNAGQQLWVGTDRGLFQLTPSGEQWTISQEFTVQTSGLAVNRILTLALQPLASGQTKLWIGTPCGLSIYEY